MAPTHNGEKSLRKSSVCAFGCFHLVRIPGLGISAQDTVLKPLGKGVPVNQASKTTPKPNRGGSYL